jgi:DNA-directed RNA polymerase alpha subunit
MNRTEAYNWLTGYLEGIKAGENALSALNTIYAGVAMAEKANVLSDILSQSVFSITMSVRTANCIRNESWNPETRKHESTYKHAINTVRDLVIRTESELLKTPNFGRKSLNELKCELAKHNLRFGMDL